MSDHQKPHNGRRPNGQFKVRQEDVDDKLADPQGAAFVADDVRLGGAVEDTGPQAGLRGEELQRMIDNNRDCVDKFKE